MANKISEVKNDGKNKVLNTNNMCRMCLVQCSDDNLVDILDATDEISVTFRITSCAGLDVMPQDPLPKKMCLDCRLQLEKSFLFRNRSKNSDTKLRQHFRLINAGKVSHVFDDSEDEFEDDYKISKNVIKIIESQLDTSKENERKKEMRQAIETASKRIHREAKALYAKQLEEELSKIEEKETSVAKKSTTKPSPTRRKEKIKEETMYEMDELETEILIEQSDDQEYEISLSDENADADADPKNIYDINDEIEFDAIEENSERRLSQSNYTMSESGDVKPAEFVLCDDFDENAEYLDEEYIEENESDDLIMESILPAIKKTIATKSGIHLDSQTKYKVFRKPGNEIEVECRTSDGKIFSIEMMIDNPTNSEFERDETGDLKVFICKKCPASFSRRGKLLSHEREHEPNISPWKCEYCQKSFPSKSTLIRHVRVHTGEKPFKCDVCGRRFIQNEILKRHSMIHSGERPHKCTHCPKKFILKETLKQHINRNHSENPVIELHKCPLCPKSFCHSSGLSRHLLIHAGRTFTCEFCDKSFNDRSALKRHAATIHNVSLPRKKDQSDATNTVQGKVKSPK